MIDLSDLKELAAKHFYATKGILGWAVPPETVYFSCELDPREWMFSCPVLVMSWAAIIHEIEDPVKLASSFHLILDENLVDLEGLVVLNAENMAKTCIEVIIKHIGTRIKE